MKSTTIPTVASSCVESSVYTLRTKPMRICLSISSRSTPGVVDPSSSAERPRLTVRALKRESPLGACAAMSPLSIPSTWMVCLGRLQHHSSMSMNIVTPYAAASTLHRITGQFDWPWAKGGADGGGNSSVIGLLGAAVLVQPARPRFERREATR